MTRTAQIAALSALAVAALLGGLTYTALRGGDDRFAQCRSSAVAGGAGAIGGPFELVNTAGQTVTSAEVLDEPALIYFGYTFCPDICPMDVARNAQAVEVLEERGEEVTPVFITVDPKRDTPEVLRDFAANMHPRMVGLTGTDEQVREAVRAYRGYSKVHDDGSDYYLVDHSTFSYLSLPGHGVVEFFRRDTGPEELADKMQCFLDAA